MCGITGWFNHPPDRKMIERMCDSIVHRGPDQKGLFESSQCSLGFMRLSIVNPQEGQQPVYNANRTIVAIGNGEIYNYKEILKTLQKQGHCINSGSDLSIIPSLYEEYGIEGVEKLRGMFAIALWDEEKKTGFLVRDQAGIKPLYYLENPQFGLIFSSEIKSILASGISASPDIEQLQNVLLYRSAELERTSFKNIRKVPPGHILSFSETNGSHLFRYKTDTNCSEFQKVETDDLSGILDRVVSMHMMADVPMGAFLSGGLDSSLVAAIMAKLSARPIQTFTVGFGMQEDERAKARAVADHIGSDHHEVIVHFDDMTRDFNKIVWHMDEPILDPAFFPSYYLARETSKHVKAVLIGEGSDEVFAGYDKHRTLLADFDNRALMARQFVGSRMPFAWKAVEAELLHTTPYLNALVARLQSTSSRELALREALTIDRETMLPSLQLMRADKSAMAHGLETRVPFLDTELIERSSRYNALSFISAENGKAPLREAAEKLLPPSIARGQKTIFFVPIDAWAKTMFNDIAVEQIKRSSFLPSVINYDRLRTSFDALTPYQKWGLLVVNQWHKVFFEGQSPESEIIPSRPAAPNTQKIQSLPLVQRKIYV